MAKQQAQASAPQTSEETTNYDTAHPLLRARTQIDEFLRGKAETDAQKHFRVTEVKEWKRIVNSVATTEDGRILLKSMLDYSGVLAPPVLANANTMVTNTIKGSFYLTWIRPFLEPKVRKELE